jgi:hypothetical protein
MADLKIYLARLNDDLNILREREAKYGDNAPLELLNQIADHQQAILLTKQALDGQLSEASLYYHIFAQRERISNRSRNKGRFLMAQNVLFQANKQWFRIWMRLKQLNSFELVILKNKIAGYLEQVTDNALLSKRFKFGTH